MACTTAKISQAQEGAGDHEEDKVAGVKEADIPGMLKSIGSCPDAYAVFEAKTARKAAVDASAQSGGIEFKGKTISLNASRLEPPSGQWPNRANTDLWFMAKRISWDLALLAWSWLFQW